MILFASRNQKKIDEFKKMFCQYEIKGLNDFNSNIDVVENENTFVGNATKKAREVLELNISDEVIADDSGLEIEFLNGFPGVKTARFLGENKTPRQRNLYILDKMKDVPQEKRQCRAVCVLVYLNKFGKKIVATGCLKGTISNKIVEGRSFGFDEIFLLKNQKAMSELSIEQKNKISARSKAVKLLLKKLKKLEITK